MWQGWTVSAALPTYNERESIRQCIDALFETGVVDEVVVCNNNAAAGTSEEVAKTRAREVYETRQGYGWSCRKALAETTGDLVILVEPDGSFDAKDIHKLLAYANDFDVVLGSRTNRELIWTGANMGFFMKWANWAVAKYMEFLFNATTLSDVGCTMRLISRERLQRIEPRFTVGGSHFGPEMMMLCILDGARVIQVPVNYKQRVGESMVCGNRWVAALLGFQMFCLVTKVRFASWGRVLTVLGALGFLGGLFLRYRMLFNGGPDMPSYEAWGRKASEAGLIAAYRGIYFPLQYQIFQACAWIAAATGSTFALVSKSCNLLFDVGTFALLRALLKRRQASPAYAWLYWLHPWFLAVFSLAYIDFQFSFFVLLTIYCLTGRTARQFLVAGIPLACAFLMKPQAQVLILATAAYGAIHCVRKRDWRPLAMLVAPMIVWLGYEAFFAASLYASLDWTAFAVLPRSYTRIVNVMPTLTARMTNIWYPLAYVLKPPDRPIFRVSDHVELFPHVQARLVASVSALALVFAGVLRAEKNDRLPVGETFAAMYGLAAIVVPFVMTSAHENHLFLGSIFLVLFLGDRRGLAFALAAHVVLVIQALNIYGAYGEWPMELARMAQSHYSAGLGLVYSCISIPCFLVVLSRLLARKAVAV